MNLGRLCFCLIGHVSDFTATARPLPTPNNLLPHKLAVSEVTLSAARHDSFPSLFPTYIEPALRLFLY